MNSEDVKPEMTDAELEAVVAGMSKEAQARANKQGGKAPMKPTRPGTIGLDL